MNHPTDWRRVWQVKSEDAVSDFELDRGRAPGEPEVENLSDRELLNFIDPKASETILDAGCGTGVNISRLCSQVKHIIGVDYTQGSVTRSQRRISSHHITNARVLLASVTDLAFADRSIDKVLCLSVLQYLDERQVRRALQEFVRVLANGGVIILHVKNFSSLYWSTLWLAKKLKRLAGRDTRLEHLRSYRWYANELVSLNCTILGYNSLNLLIIDAMPKRLLSFLHTFELRHHRHALFQLPFLRRHGAEL